MTADEHSSYFGQFIAPTGDQATVGDTAVVGNTTREDGSNNPSSRTLDTGTTPGNGSRREIVIIAPEGPITAGVSQRPSVLAVQDKTNTSRRKAAVTGTTRGHGRVSVARGQGGNERTPTVHNEEPDDPFQADVISRLEELIDKYRKEKVTRTETLFLLLLMLYDAGLTEEDRRSILEEYMLYVNIIASKSKDVER